MSGEDKLYADARARIGDYLAGGGLGETVAGIVLLGSFSGKVTMDADHALALCLLADEALDARKARDEAEVEASVHALALCLRADEALDARRARDEAEVEASVSGLMDRLAARGTKP